jgi:hypothetical protein
MHVVSPIEHRITPAGYKSMGVVIDLAVCGFGIEKTKRN